LLHELLTKTRSVSALQGASTCLASVLEAAQSSEGDYSSTPEMLRFLVRSFLSKWYYNAELRQKSFSLQRQ